MQGKSKFSSICFKPVNQPADFAERTEPFICLDTRAVPEGQFSVIRLLYFNLRTKGKQIPFVNSTEFISVFCEKCPISKKDKIPASDCELDLKLAIESASFLW